MLEVVDKTMGPRKNIENSNVFITMLPCWPAPVPMLPPNA